MTLQGNQIAKAFTNAGLKKKVKPKRHWDKKFKCKRCDSDMIHPTDTNIMYCSNPKCNNYYIFK